MKSFHRRISDGFRMFWKMPVDSVKQMLEFTQESVDNPAGAVLSRGWDFLRVLKQLSAAIDNPEV